jgi:uncharacterized protein involved in exopolysaccharide biosynthesis
MLLAAGAGLLTALLLALFLPPAYQSIGTVLIEQQEMPPELVRSTVTSYADQRVQVISQRVMTTQTLLEIIRRYNLYPRQRSRDSREAAGRPRRPSLSASPTPIARPTRRSRSPMSSARCS